MTDISNSAGEKSPGYFFAYSEPGACITYISIIDSGRVIVVIKGDTTF